MTGKVAHSLGLHRKLQIGAMGLAAIATPIFIGLTQVQCTRAQNAAASALTARAYDVVSIRPAKPSNDMSWKTTDDGFFTSGTSVRKLIMDVYGLITNDQLSVLPDWADTRFDIQAKVDSDTGAALKKLSEKDRNQQYNLMLEAVLAERFNLKIRRETKEISVYALVVAKGGAKLKETPPNIPMGYTMKFGPSLCVLSGHGIEIAALAQSLSGNAGRMIVDKTGLTGKYDMDLKWSPEENQSSDDSGPSIFTAVQEQLGLKFESTRAPMETIVVEHIDRAYRELSDAGRPIVLLSGVMHRQHTYCEKMNAFKGNRYPVGAFNPVDAFNPCRRGGAFGRPGA